MSLRITRKVLAMKKITSCLFILLPYVSVFLQGIHYQLTELERHKLPTAYDKIWAIHIILVLISACFIGWYACLKNTKANTRFYVSIIHIIVFICSICYVFTIRPMVTFAVTVYLNNMLFFILWICSFFMIIITEGYKKIIKK